MFEVFNGVLSGTNAERRKHSACGRNTWKDLLGKLPGGRLIAIRCFHHLPVLSSLPYPSLAAKCLPSLPPLHNHGVLTVLTVSSVLFSVIESVSHRVVCLLALELSLHSMYVRAVRKESWWWCYCASCMLQSKRANDEHVNRSADEWFLIMGTRCSSYRYRCGLICQPSVRKAKNSDAKSGGPVGCVCINASGTKINGSIQTSPHFPSRLSTHDSRLTLEASLTRKIAFGCC